MLRSIFTIFLVVLPVRLAICEPLNVTRPPEVAFRDDAALHHEVARLVKQLDSGEFEVRQAAFKSLEVLGACKELRPRLAAEFQRIRIQSDISFEVRKQLESLSMKLPKATLYPVEDVSPLEIDKLVSNLEDESYSVRLGAMERLQWLLKNPRWGLPVMRRLRQRIDAGPLSVDSTRWIEPIYEQARGSWLIHANPREQLPKITKAQLRQWVNDLVSSSDSSTPDALYRIQCAQRALFDGMALDSDVPIIKKALEDQLKVEGLSQDAKKRLLKVLELTQPAMVAEFWESQHHLGVQHLLIGVPSQSPGAIRPSHFDRIDENTAHCVSGTNLSKGDYPVGVAIPHPNRQGALFHLVNLSTPRRRMAYQYDLKRDESVRLRELTQRTTARLLRRKQMLTEREISTLGTLDLVEVSRFAGEFFLTVEDTRIHRVGVRWGATPSLHNLFCELLITEGTKEAIPGLVKAIEAKRFIPPTSRSTPYDLPWIAALSIAQRDPWPEVDAWLAERIDRQHPLMKDTADSPELGATAAGILLSRHHQKPSEMGLVPSTESFFRKIKLVGYRYSSTEKAEAITQWWHETQNRAVPIETKSL